MLPNFRNCALVLALLPGALSAHHDIGTTILALDQKIAAGATADLHYLRALEYRALRKRKEAQADLRKALALQPRHRGSITALIPLLQGPEAMTLAQTYLASATDPKHRLEAHYLIAQVADRSDNEATALVVCEKIQTLHPEHPSEIDLLHARLLLTNGKPARAAAVLKSAHQKHKSIVLRNAWIDAALSAKQISQVLPIIEEELTSTRFRASWLIRRARANLATNTPGKVRSDLHSALQELNTRILPDRPDLTLIADRGLALALLGSKDLAQRDLTTLKNSTLSKSSYTILEAELQNMDHE